VKLVASTTRTGLRPGETVRLTRQGCTRPGWRVAVALLRNTLIMVEAGKEPSRPRVTFATAWTF